MNVLGTLTSFVGAKETSNGPYTRLRQSQLVKLHRFADVAPLLRCSAWYGRIQTLKSKSSQGALPMPEPLADMLKGYLKTWTRSALPLLFANQIGRPMSANKVVQRKLWPILDKLKIPRCELHAFRHTHSSLLVEGGAPVSVAQAQRGTPTHVSRSGSTVTLSGTHSATRLKSWPRFCSQMRPS